MQVYIPSLGRSEKIFEDSPLTDMDEETQSRCAVVVGVGDWGKYRAALPRHIEVHELETKGIAATRHGIGLIARQEEHAKFLMLDDDVRFLIRRSPDTWRLRGTKTKEVASLFGIIEHLLEDHAHVGVSAREGNNRAGTGAFPLITNNTRTIRALGYRTDDFLSVEHCRVAVMEDFDVNLQLLRRGLSNCCINYWAQGQKMTNAPGGCSEYRTHEVHEKAAKKLAELHEGFVRLRQKSNKTDREGFGTRTEVTISWKRAYESANISTDQGYPGGKSNSEDEQEPSEEG